MRVPPTAPLMMQPSLMSESVSLHVPMLSIPIEQQYEQELRGREGVQFVEVNARNQIVSTGRARESITAEEGKALSTNIDLDLQEYIHSLFADTLAAAAVAMVPQTGEVLAIYKEEDVLGQVAARHRHRLRRFSH